MLASNTNQLPSVACAGQLVAQPSPWGGFAGWGVFDLPYGHIHGGSGMHCSERDTGGAGSSPWRTLENVLEGNELARPLC